MKIDAKSIKKHNPNILDLPYYDFKIIKVINKGLKGINKEHVDYFIKRIKRIGYDYVCFGNICDNLSYINDITKCGIFCGIGFTGKEDYIKGEWQDVWKQVFEKDGVYIVTDSAEYKEVVKVIWDWKNNKIYKYENNKG